jgi:2-haloacid dehalogenase
MAKLSGIRACVFDAYGTLFDFGSAAARCPEIPEAQRTALTTLWRDKQVQYLWLRSLQNRYEDFWRVTGDALQFALETLGLMEEGRHRRLMDLYLSLSCFPEVPDCLAQLRKRGFKTAILSNGTPAMLEALVSAAGLEGMFDALLSADSVKIYKTHPRIYQYALDRMDCRADQVCFQSSNGWDAYGASDFGMRVVWCNRSGQRPELLPGKPDAIVRSLAELPALLA